MLVAHAPSLGYITRWALRYPQEPWDEGRNPTPRQAGLLPLNLALMLGGLYLESDKKAIPTKADSCVVDRHLRDPEAGCNGQYARSGPGGICAKACAGKLKAADACCFV
jgi:hypothetical protein